MDTNVKSFKYSKIGKFICLALCFITMLSCVNLVVNMFASYDYFMENSREKSASFTDSSAFRWSFVRDINTIYGNLKAQNGEEDYFQESLFCKSIKVYAEMDGVSSKEYVYDVYSHYENVSFTSQAAKEHDVYLVIEKGKLSSSGFSDNFISYLKDYSWFNEFDVLYVYFDFSVYDNGNIIEKLETYDDYIAARNYYDTAVNYYDGINTYIVFAVILFVLTFVFGIAYLTVTGKKNSYDKAKLAFIDYVPLGLHLAISGGLGFGAGCLMVIAFDEFTFPAWYGIKVILLFAAVVWLLLMELSASVVRSIRSDRKFYKFLLTFWIVYPYIKLNKLIFKRIKKNGKRLVRALRYRPKAVRRNTIILLIGYFFINFILLLFIAFGISFMFEWNGIPLFIAMLLFIAFNTAAVILSMKYIENLDDVADHMIEHKDFEGDIDSLPPMLKELVKSMQFTNEELRNAVAQAVKDERLRTELVTNVSHDLKTPLTSIINYVDLLSKCDIQDDKAKNYLGVLEDKSAKLKRLIEDLIEASKVTSGNVTVNLAPINLSELCLQATVEEQDEFNKAGLSLVVKPQNEPHIVIADGSKTYRIIGNLLSNARKYSAKASRVYVDVYNENGFGVFEIKNVSAQPLDISADELTERFVRGDKSRNQEGNGLGLSIAKELAKLQNGNLEITIDGDLFKAKVKLPTK
ncbi:MAG: GHKL domain-containing protein [Eubacterium sp.]|nr:GHKL domain-containing protein [Eubacterium sp.]